MTRVALVPAMSFVAPVTLVAFVAAVTLMTLVAFVAAVTLMAPVAFVAAVTLVAFVAAVTLVAFMPAMSLMVALALTSAGVLVPIAIAVIAMTTGILVPTLILWPAVPTLGMGTVLCVGGLPVTTVSRVVLSGLGVAHLRLFPWQRLCSLRGTFCVGGGVGVVFVVFVVFVVAPGLGVVRLVGQQIVGSGPVERVTLVVSELEEAGVRVVENAHGVAVLEYLDPHPWPWHLVPHEVDGLCEPRPGYAAHDENVGVCRGLGQLPSPREHGALDVHPRAPPSGDLDHEGVRMPCGEPRGRRAQTHRRAPSRHAHRTATNKAARKRNISTTAVAPISATTTAHGYMKSISTSKARKSKVARYHRTW